MREGWIALTLAAALCAVPGAGRAAPGDVVLPGQDLSSPPAGTPEDQALWRAGLEVTTAVHVERARATRLQLVVANLRYVERLRQLGARGGESAARATALEKRVNDAHAFQFGILTGRWLVEPFRVCGYPAMEFGSMLNYGKADAAELVKHRAMLYGCVEQAEGMLREMRQGNDGLEVALREADTALAAAGLGSPPLAPAAAAERGASTSRPGERERGEDHGEHEARERAGGHESKEQGEGR